MRYPITQTPILTKLDLQQFVTSSPLTVEMMTTSINMTSAVGHNQYLDWEHQPVGTYLHGFDNHFGDWVPVYRYRDRSCIQAMLWRLETTTLRQTQPHRWHVYTIGSLLVVSKRLTFGSFICRHCNLFMVMHIWIPFFFAWDFCQ